jgi:glycerol-3-phosphate dehydrogenase
VSAQTGLSPARISELFSQYGSLAEKIATEIAQHGHDTGLHFAPMCSRGEVITIIKMEQVHRIDDFLLRRSSLGIRGLVSGGLVEELGAIMAETLGWSELDKLAEIKRVTALLTTRHYMTL